MTQRVLMDFGFTKLTNFGYEIRVTEEHSQKTNQANKSINLILNLYISVQQPR